MGLSILTIHKGVYTLGLQCFIDYHSGCLVYKSFVILLCERKGPAWNKICQQGPPRTLRVPKKKS